MKSDSRNAGSCSLSKFNMTQKGVENLLRHYIPEVDEVVTV